MRKCVVGIVSSAHNRIATMPSAGATHSFAGTEDRIATCRKRHLYGGGRCRVRKCVPRASLVALDSLLNGVRCCV